MTQVRRDRARRSRDREIAATGRVFVMGEQQAALVNGDLALTSTRSTSGSVTAEVARRQPDGTWLWIIDRYEIAREVRDSPARDADG